MISEQQLKEIMRELIVHGVPETDQMGDSDAIYDILSYLECTNRSCEINKIYRLGRKQYRKKKMILVEFNSKQAVQEILNKSPRLMYNNYLRDFIVRADLTLSQRENRNRTSHNLRDAAQGSRGAGQRDQDNLGSHTDRYEEQNRRNTEHEIREDSPSAESPRRRRFSYSSVVSGSTDLDSSFISDVDENSEVDNETVGLNDSQQPGWRVPMYMKVDGQLYLITDTAEEEALAEITIDMPRNTQSNNFFGVGMPV